MTGARNSTRLNYVPMGLVGRARAAGASTHVDRAVREEEERREDASTADPVPEDLRMIERVSEEQEAKAPRNRGQANEVRRAKVARRAQATRQHDLRFERPGHEEDREPCQDEGQAGSIPLPSHVTAYHATPP